MPCAASRSAPRRWRSWSMRRPPAIRSSRFNFFPRSPKKACSAFDHGAARWRWDLDRIRAKGYTDNVVDLMVGKLGRLPAETQTALQQLACLGNSAEIAMLSIVLAKLGGRGPRGPLGGGPSGAGRALGRLLQVRPRPCAGSRLFIDPRAIACRSSSADRKIAGGAGASGEAGRGDLRNRRSTQPGSRLITSVDEREQLAEFNLTAGKRANASTAYASALSYFAAGRGLLAEDCWERRRELIFALDHRRAECEILTGALSDAESAFGGTVCSRHGCG